MGKATKATRKFASSGQLKKTIQSRKKHQKIKKKIEGRRGAKGKGKGKAPVQDDDDAEEEDTTEFVRSYRGRSCADLYFVASRERRWMTFSGLGSWRTIPTTETYGTGYTLTAVTHDLSVSQMNMDQDDSDAEDEDEQDFADDESFASVDDLEGMFNFFQCPVAHCQHGTADEGVAHIHELSKLAEKDPEFYKYLQDNDQELLEFDPEDAVDEDEEDEEDVEMESETLPILTKDILRGWQKALLDASLPCVDLGFH